jgi:hypothetical protein
MAKERTWMEGLEMRNVGRLLVNVAALRMENF